MNPSSEYDYCPHCHSENRCCLLFVGRGGTRPRGLIQCIDCGHEEEQVFKVWFRVFDSALRHICDVRAESHDRETPLHPYDPRINGDGDVIWQAA